jgi:hypothetical protein
MEEGEIINPIGILTKVLKKSIDGRQTHYHELSDSFATS